MSQLESGLNEQEKEKINQLWAQLNAEAHQEYRRLNPTLSPTQVRMYLAILATVLVVLAVIVNAALIQPMQRDRAALQTQQFNDALVQAARNGTATQQMALVTAAAVETAEFNAARDATAAVQATQTRSVVETVQAVTQVVQTQVAQTQAADDFCRKNMLAEGYRLDVVQGPTYSPEPVGAPVAGQKKPAPPTVYAGVPHADFTATWVLHNPSQQCDVTLALAATGPDLPGEVAAGYGYQWEAFRYQLFDVNDDPDPTKATLLPDARIQRGQTVRLVVYFSLPDLLQTRQQSGMTRILFLKNDNLPLNTISITVFNWADVLYATPVPTKEVVVDRATHTPNPEKDDPSGDGEH